MLGVTINIIFFLHEVQEFYQCEYDVKKTYYLANKKTLDVKDEVVELLFMSCMHSKGFKYEEKSGCSLTEAGTLYNNRCWIKRD